MTYLNMNTSGWSNRPKGNLLFPAPEWSISAPTIGRIQRYGWGEQQRAVSLAGPRRPVLAAVSDAIEAAEVCEADLWAIAERSEQRPVRRSIQQITPAMEPGTVADWFSLLAGLIEERRAGRASRPVAVVVDDVPGVIGSLPDATQASAIEVLSDLALNAETLNMYVALVYVSGRRWGVLGDLCEHIEFDDVNSFSGPVRRWLTRQAG